MDKRKVDAALKILDDALVDASLILDENPAKRRKLLIPSLETIQKLHDEESKPNTNSNGKSISIESRETQRRLNLLRRITAPLKASRRFRFKSDTLASVSLENILKLALKTTTPSSPSPLEIYQPSSRRDFMARLETFRDPSWTAFSMLIPTTSNGEKIPALSSVGLALHGWYLINQDAHSFSTPSTPQRHQAGMTVRVKCGFCRRDWKISMPINPTPDVDMNDHDGQDEEIEDGDDFDLAFTIQHRIAEKLGSQVESGENHTPTCPWKSGPCNPSIYSIPFSTPADLRNELISSRMRIYELGDLLPFSVILSDFDAESIFQSMLDCLPPVDLDESQTESSPMENQTQIQSEKDKRIVLASNLLSLLGWRVLEDSRSKHNPILTCHMCLRRVGCWSFTSIREGLQSHSVDVNEPISNNDIDKEVDFDPILPHATYCPWINKRCSEVSNQPRMAWETLLHMLEKISRVRKRTSLGSMSSSVSSYSRSSSSPPEQILKSPFESSTSTRRDPRHALAYIKRLLNV